MSVKTVQADGHSRRRSGYHQHIKRQKNRAERRAGNRNPEHPPSYGRYRGWET